MSSLDSIPAVMPFDAIVSGATVRFTHIDKIQYLSVRDLIMHMCGKDNNQAIEIWRTISESKKKEIQDFLANFKFPGREQYEQPVITFPGAIRLAMFLPGENAKRNRVMLSQIIHSYYAGDKSLLKEIEATATSVNDMEAFENRKRKRELEETEILNMRADIEYKKIANISSFVNLMRVLDPNWMQDTELVLQTEDLLKNTMFNPGGQK